ncbi:saccharopine dehydrogenase [Kitasatospora sp. NPDC089509]|uniref:saccharopine dehydrogenase n=1 Tax=Kitasatospora sp. NPDC089509 TaxID=3364079 RepID=UPI00381CF134
MARRVGPAPAAPLLVVGGYGVVGAQVSRLLRQRHPRLPLVLGGRTPRHARALAASIGASTVTVDVGAEEPLAALPERPAAVLAVVSDPDDHLIVDAMRRGIPIADIHRAAPAGILDITVAAARERPPAPVHLSGSWFAGLGALSAAAAVRELGAAERVDITVLASTDDRVGPDSWGFGERLAWPYYPMHDGRRRPTQPLSDLREVRCPDGVVRAAALIGTLEQSTAPLLLRVPTVRTRLALQSRASLYGLVGLKRSGTLRLLARPGLRRVRSALLERPGTGDFAGLTVTASNATRSVSVELLDPSGQAHLSALGAVLAAERVLAPDTAPGISFPEQYAEPAADLDALRRAGVVVRLSGFTRPPGPHPSTTARKDIA